MDNIVGQTKEQGEGLLRIYHASTPTDPVLNFAKIARSLGISAGLTDLGLSDVSLAELRAQISAGTSVWDIGSLGKLIDLASWRVIASAMAESNCQVLILVTGTDDLQCEIVKILSQAVVKGVHGAEHPDSVIFPAKLAHLSAELSGHCYARSRRDALALDVSGNVGAETVMEYGNGLAAFVSLQLGASHTFIWSTCSIFDVERPLKREIEFEEAVDEYIPAIIFLRKVFGERCWHSPRVGADVTIDDPLLEKRYGFIYFPELLRLVKELGVHLTVAFIPWNHWRTRKRNLQEFLNHAADFGICAHGCDHARKEFGSREYRDLLQRSHLAVKRMDHHQEQTGMGWDPIMICPREEYTVEALQALADTGRFLGLVNTGCIPRNLNFEHVRGVDLLLPAQDSFFGFPIFKRHYWSDVSVFAMAAFLGKPVILVEHHDFFRDQNRAFKEFVAKLNTACPTVQWSGLADLARQTCLCRRVSPEAMEVRFFTDEFLMRNPTPHPQVVRFRRRLPPDRVIESIMVNGLKVTVAREGEFICFETILGGNSTATVQLHRCTSPIPDGNSRGWTYDVGIAIRRLLSEARDNWLSRNQILLNAANRLVKLVR